MIGAAEARRRFNHHQMDHDRVHRQGRIRSMIRDVAEVVDQTCPDGREKSLAWTHLEEAMFWANAAIARERQ